jgi:hypothetical protein
MVDGTGRQKHGYHKKIMAERVMRALGELTK